MRLHHAAGRGRDTEIAIGRVGAQAVIEIFLAVMAEGELMLWLARFEAAGPFARAGFGGEFSSCSSLHFTSGCLCLLRFGFAMTGLLYMNYYSAASAAPPCAFDQPAGSPMNFSTSASIFGSNCPLVRATARTSFQVVSACRVTPRSPMIFLLCG